MQEEKIYSKLLELLKKEIKKQLPEIEESGDWLWAHPETGFKEVETQKYCLDVLKKHGLKAETYPDVTGFTCTWDTGKPGPTVAILGEMDSVVCFGHPDCNPKTGAAHACGHAVQMASVLGAFIALVESGALKELCGRVKLMGVPAEECLETEWRLNEIKAGRLHYLGGKQEYLYRGAFEDVDVIINMHSGALNDGTIRPMGRHNGFISKTVTFHGKAAHAAAAPEQGVNALYMANTALTALNAQRETFRDEDRVRVHAIMNRGGEINNVIPETASLEAQCRANNIEAELDAAAKFDRSMGAGAYAFGGTVTVSSQPGYLPYTPTKRLDAIAMEVADDILGEGHGVQGQATAGSEDMGDVSTMKPFIQVYINYMHGTHHAADYGIADRKIYETSPLFLAMLAVKLLDEDGKLAKEVMASHRPQFSGVKEYCEFMDSLFSEKVLP